MGMPCHILVVKKKKNSNSIKNWPDYHSVNHVYIKLTETKGMTNGE